MVQSSVLASYPELDDGDGPRPAASLPIQVLPGGLINQTYALGRRFVLQRLHPVFRPEVNDDIAALVPALRRAGVPVPELVRTASGATFVPADGTWRILTRLAGETRHRLRAPSDARALGGMVARFHGALRDAEHTFAFERPGAHDTGAHVASVQAALDAAPSHRLAAAVAPIATALETAWAQFPQPVGLPLRIIHGDLKVSNVLWTGGDVVGVVDLDTMGYYGVDIELGDALRSWCNLGVEDDPAPALSVETFAFAVEGYVLGARPWLTAPEVESLPRSLERIALELSARFAADALRESYFGWDASRFPGRGEHNLVRAKNQLGLMLAAQRERRALEEAVARAVAASGHV